MHNRDIVYILMDMKRVKFSTTLKASCLLSEVSNHPVDVTAFCHVRYTCFCHEDANKLIVVPGVLNIRPLERLTTVHKLVVSLSEEPLRLVSILKKDEDRGAMLKRDFSFTKNGQYKR